MVHAYVQTRLTEGPESASTLHARRCNSRRSGRMVRSRRNGGCAARPLRHHRIFETLRRDLLLVTASAATAGAAASAKKNIPNER